MTMREKERERHDLKVHPGLGVSLDSLGHSLRKLSDPSLWYMPWQCLQHSLESVCLSHFPL